MSQSYHRQHQCGCDAAEPESHQRRCHRTPTPCRCGCAPPSPPPKPCPPPRPHPCATADAWVQYWNEAWVEHHPPCPSKPTCCRPPRPSCPPAPPAPCLPDPCHSVEFERGFERGFALAAALLMCGSEVPAPLTVESPAGVCPAGDFERGFELGLVAAQRYCPPVPVCPTTSPASPF